VISSPANLPFLSKGICPEIKRNLPSAKTACEYGPIGSGAFDELIIFFHNIFPSIIIKYLF